MKPGDVVVGAFPAAKIAKSRPAVVLSTEAYHLHRPDLILGVITTQPPPVLSPTDCVLTEWWIAGLRAPSFFRLYLIRFPQREVQVVDRLADRDWHEVRRFIASGLGR